MVQMLLTSVLAVGLAFLFDRLGVPAGVMLGAMVGIAVSRMVGWQIIEAPGPTRFLAFLVVGWLLGQSFDTSTLASIRSASRPVLVVCLSLIVLTGVLTWALASYSEVDPMTALLASAPGGLVHIGAISADTGANTGVVVTVHLVRLVSVVVMLPIVARLIKT